jgi:crotonobetainyl-CoA:carnitine CoA-transferase CaiB-like acyl-CoA transferase
MLMMLDEERYWAPTCRALGREELIEKYADGAVRRAAWPEICNQLADTIGALSRVALLERLTRESCIFSFVSSPPEVVVDPAVSENGYLMAHPDHPPLRLAAAPAQFDNELPTIRRAGPDKGRHTREVLGEIGYKPSSPPRRWSSDRCPDPSRPDRLPRERISIGGVGVGRSRTMMKVWQHESDPA